MSAICLKMYFMLNIQRVIKKKKKRGFGNMNRKLCGE